MKLKYSLENNIKTVVMPFIQKKLDDINICLGYIKYKNLNLKINKNQYVDNFTEITEIEFICMKTYNDNIDINNKIVSIEGCQMPHCCGLYIIHNLTVQEGDLRNLKIGSLLFKEFLNFPKHMNYSKIICTTNEDQASHKILKNNDFNIIDDQNNRKTYNLISVWSKSIYNPNKKE